VPTADTVKYDHLMTLLYFKERPIIFTGETGVGKSIIVQKRLQILKSNLEIEPVV